MYQSVNRPLLYFFFLIILLSYGCAAELLEGMAVGDIAALGGEEALAAEGLEVRAATGEIIVANEEVFFGELRKVRLEESSILRGNPRLYLLKNGVREYFGEVLDEGTVRLTKVDRDISMPEGMELYRVRGNNVNVRSALGDVYKVYRHVTTNDIVLVLRQVGDWYEVQLGRNLTGFISATLLAKISLHEVGYAKSDNGNFRILSPEDRADIDYPRITKVTWTSSTEASYYLLEVQLAGPPFNYDATNYSPLLGVSNGTFLTGLTYQTFQGAGKQVHRFRVLAKRGAQTVAQTPWRYINYTR